MALLSFGPWEPDKGPFSAQTIDVCLNLNPLAGGWGPFPDLVDVGASLGATCFGAWYARKADGTFVLLAGTSDALFRYNDATSAWTNISGASAPYNVPDGDMWHAIQFGTKFIVVSINAPPQVYDVEAAGSFADLAGSPPKAKYIWIAGDFVVLGYLAVGASEFPQDIHWSGINDATYWTIDRKKGSDRQTLPDGDEIMGGFGFPGGARIFQRKARRAMVFTGGAFIFDIKVIDAARGAIAPNSIVQLSANDYVYWNSDGIYRGDETLPIGAQRVDGFLLDKVRGDVDLGFLETVQGVADPFNKVVMWVYTRSAGGQRILGWDWELDRFFIIDGLDVLMLVSLTTIGTSPDAMDAIFPGGMDTVTPSLDSRVWKGGAPTIGVMGTGGQLAYFSGDALAGTIETGTLELNSSQRTFVNGAKVKGNPGSGSTVRALTGTLPSDTLTVGTAMSRSSRTGQYPLRADGFYHRFRVNTAAADATFTHLHGIDTVDKFSGKA
jgi:hypothetical protein